MFTIDFDKRNPTMTMTYSSEIEQIVQTVFSTMLDLEVESTEAVMDPAESGLIGTIQISGDWVGTVVLKLCPETAKHCSAAMLGISPEEANLEDQQDVVAELVNMVGGNFKGLLEGSQCLSLPNVITGSDFQLRVHASKQTEKAAFVSQHGLLQVTIYKKTSDS